MPMTATLPEAQVCIPNINPRERRRRLVAGIIPLAIALVVLAILMIAGVNRWWRLLLLPLFWAAATGYFQWRDKT
jgi:hypothetical protein